MIAKKAQRSWCFLILFCNIPSSPQQCVTTDFKKKFSGKLNEDSFKPLFSIQENSYGILFHKCLYYCEQDKRCMGFQICKVSESLYQCQTCCHWMKIRGQSITNTSDCKYLEKVRYPVNYFFSYFWYTVEPLDFVVTQFSRNSWVPVIRKLTSSTN